MRVLSWAFLGVMVSSVAFSAPLSSSTVNANTTEEEYSPIPELNYVPPKKSSESIFDEVRLHAGAAFLNSYQSIPLGQGQRVRGTMRGAQFNFGVDLFSTHWLLQGALFSLPQTNLDHQSQISSNGFELRFIYEDNLAEQLTIHGGLGIESRNYSIRSPIGDNSMSSGAWVIATGLDYWPAPFISAGLELSAHPPMANEDDPSSFDLGIRVNGHF